MRYTFTHSDEENSIEITYSTNTDEAHQLVQSFAYFMKAVSFHDKTIKSALEDVASEIT